MSEVFGLCYCDKCHRLQQWNGESSEMNAQFELTIVPPKAITSLQELAYGAAFSKTWCIDEAGAGNHLHVAALLKQIAREVSRDLSPVCW